MVNPKRDCTLVPSRHSLDMMNWRGLAMEGLEKIVRRARWRSEGEGGYDVV